MSEPGERRGSKAERLAVQMLEIKGYDILATNYRSRYGEIDIIASIENLVVFVEVKERTVGPFGRAEEAVDRDKIQRMLTTADHFVLEHPEWADHIWRIDLVAITRGRAGSILRKRHIENLVID